MHKNGGFFRETVAVLAIIVVCLGGMADQFILPRAEIWRNNLQRYRRIEANRAQALDLVGMRNRVEVLKLRAREIVEKNAAAGDSMQYYDAIQRCGQGVGLTLGRISPRNQNTGSAEQSQSGVARLEFHISASGSYEQIVEFLESLRVLPVFHQINGFRITPRNGAGGLHLVDAEIDLQFAKFFIDPSLVDATQEGNFR